MKHLFIIFYSHILYFLYKRKISKISKIMFPNLSLLQTRKIIVNSLIESHYSVKNIGKVKPENISVVGDLDELINNGGIVALLHVGNDSLIQIKLNSLGVVNTAIEGEDGFFFKLIEKKMKKFDLAFLRPEKHITKNIILRIKNKEVVMAAIDISANKNTIGKILNQEFYLTDYLFHLSVFMKKPLYLTYSIDNTVYLERLNHLFNKDSTYSQKVSIYKEKSYGRVGEIIKNYPDRWWWGLIIIGLLKTHKLDSRSNLTP